MIVSAAEDPVYDGLKSERDGEANRKMQYADEAKCSLTANKAVTQ